MKSESLNGETGSPLTQTIPGNSFPDHLIRGASHNLIKSLASVLVTLVAIMSLGSSIVRATGCGGANFTPATGSPISVPGNNPRQVVVADFNLDGKPDMAVSPTSGTGGAVYLGNGSGGFGSAKPFASFGYLVVGDFNGDGKPDLATLLAPNQGSNKVTILLGDGTGSFTVASGSPFAPPSPANFMVAGDFNLDGKLDLALTLASTTAAVTVLLGDGSGGFSLAGPPTTVGSFPQDFAIGDFNLDGKPDVVVANNSSNSLTILLGDGAGGFSQAQGSPVPSQGPTGVAVGDFNLDGKPDLAVASNASLNVTFYLGNGTGGFTKTNQSLFVFAPVGLATADVNLDGQLDVIVADAQTGAVILLGDGSGNFATAAGSPISVGMFTGSIAIGDFNLDGRPDFATTNFNSKDISIELNSCTSGGLLQFSQPNYTVQEDLAATTITVTRTGDTSGSATVSYATNDGKATQKNDYEIAMGTLTFAPGDTSKTFQVLLNEDMYSEGAETFGLHLTNATGANIGQQGAATVTITDDSPESLTNPIDDAQSFVYMHYHDFLNREPDPGGLAFWTNEINSCGGNQACIDVKRVSVSAAFVVSIEFQETGFLVHRIYKASYGNLPGAPVPVKFNEFMPDSQEIGKGLVVNQPGWQQVLENNKQAFVNEFVQRARFTQAYPTSQSPTQFVNALFANAGVTSSPADRAAAMNEFGAAADTSDPNARARALRDVAENPILIQQEFNRAFVLMQYFGYLRRDPNAAPESSLDYQGYNFWLNKLNQFNGNYVNAEMVKAFIAAGEYRQRFGQ